MSSQRNTVALAVSAIVASAAGFAVAGGITATNGRVSTQYVAAVGASTTTAARQVTLADLGASNVTARLNAEYATNDTITFTFPCNCLVDTSLPSTITATAPSGITVNNLPTFALLNSNSGAATYRVTSLSSPGNSTKNAQVVLPNTVKVDLAGAGSGVSVTFSAATSSGAAFDTSTTFDPTTTSYTATKTLVSVTSQFAASVTGALDGIIDVNPASGSPLTTFTTSSSDVLTVRTGTTDVSALTPSSFSKTADVSAVTYTVSGDFSWATEALKASVFTGTCPSGSTRSTVTLVPATAGSVSWTCTGQNSVGESTTSGGVSTLSINAAAQTGLVSLPTASFTVGASVAYASPYTGLGASATSTTASSVPTGMAAGTAAGSWSINGAQVFVPYMPYGSTIDQIIYVANKSSVSGDITVQYINTDTTSVVSLGKVGTINGRSTLNISGLIRDKLPAAVQASGRLALIITINAPTADVDVLASYKIGDDRAYVATRKLN